MHPWKRHMKAPAANVAMNILTLVFITKLKFRVDVLGVPFRNLDLDSRGSEDNPDRDQALVFGDINLGMVAEELSDVDSGHFAPPPRS